MTPMTAAATRIALADNALNPETAAYIRRLVHLYLRVGQGKTVQLATNAASLRVAIREAFGAAITGFNYKNQPQQQNGYEWDGLIASAARVEAYGSTLAPSNMVSNGNVFANATGWTASGGGTTTAVRSTAQTLIGPASLLIDTDGLAANQGAYLLSPASPAAALTKVLSYRAGCWYRDSAGTGTVRLFIDERAADDLSSIGTPTTSGALTPTTTWQQGSVARTCAAGNRVRVGMETTGTADRAWHVAGMYCIVAQDNIQVDGGAGAITLVSAPTTIHVALQFDGVQFIPELLYDALDANLDGTLASDKDTLSHDVMQLSLT